MDDIRLPRRRRTDFDDRDVERRDRRRIAEDAYRLFVERGCDPRDGDECWRLAELHARALAQKSP